jgi:alcohol dehydrogenase class IV
MAIEVIVGSGTFDRLGDAARRCGMSRALVVADRGIVAAGFADRAGSILETAGVAVSFFHDFGANPDTSMVEAGRRRAAAERIDGIVALGGGSSLDCAKGVNFVLTNGGSMRDYRGHGKASKPMLPSIGIPTTAGTGSEAQSFAIISDAETHAKMACGDDKAMFRVVLLDPVLTVSQPRDVTAIAGYDAISHAVEAYVTKTRTPESRAVASEAWRLLQPNFERVLADPGDLVAREAMLVGANRAGAAIELSMLGAAHGCANPLTAKYGTTHGVAIAVMLPHVVRWNADVVDDLYRELWPTGDVAARLDQLARAAGLPGTLREIGASRDDLDGLAADAATQWTGQHNPRAFDEHAARELYERAW